MLNLKNIFLPIGVVALCSFQLMPDAIIYDVPEEFKVEFEDYQIYPTEYTELYLDDGVSTIYIPEDAFVDLEGNVVEDPVTIKFRKYDNAADMAFSKIPMTYKGKCFNSSGMFEIQGEANGQPVRIAHGKSLKIDYQLAQKNPDSDFYYLKNNQWKLKADVPALSSSRQNEASSIPPPPPPPPVVEEVVEDEYEEYIEVEYAYTDVPNEDGMREVNKESYEKVLETMDVELATDDAEEPIFLSSPFPDVISGMNIENFGIYNFDQIYNLENKIDVVAKYQDKNGKPIENLHTLSLIDLDFNGAFSFGPNRFICNAKGNNVLFLLDKDGGLYMLDIGKFEHMNISRSGEYTFTLKKMDGIIDNADDLAEYLGLS